MKTWIFGVEPIFVLKDFGGNYWNSLIVLQDPVKSKFLDANFQEISEILERALIKLAIMWNLKKKLGGISWNFGIFQPTYHNFNMKTSILPSSIEMLIKAQLNTMNVLYTMWILTTIIANTHQ